MNMLDSNNYLEIDGYTMGTTYSIKILASSIDENKIKNDVEAILNSINMDMSTYIDSSSISKFNNFPLGIKYPLSNDFYKVINFSKHFYDMTDGKFDITINPLVQLWGFSKNTHLEKLPSKNQIDSTLQYIGMGNLIIQTDKTLTKKRELTIDLSAIAKGYAVDELSEYLNKINLKNHMVEIGGEVRASGKGKEKKNWIIGLQNPESINFDLFLKVPLLNKSLATSGNYRNYYDINGKRYSHIISPKTGYPIDNNILSVSIIARECMYADALATALMMFNIDDGMKLVESLDDVEVLYILDDHTISYSAGFTFTHVK